jgi:two-component system chemotaxis sensor kinase CheA
VLFRIGNFIRNRIDHGIESPEARASVGNDRRGSISCGISGIKQGIQPNLSNNGKEIDLTEIRI